MALAVMVESLAVAAEVQRMLAVIILSLLLIVAICVDSASRRD